MVTIMRSLFDKDVALNAILYVVKQLGGKCDMHAVCKILYFADQEHLSQYSRSITGDDYIAMQYGPVPSHVYDMMKAVRGDSYFSDTKIAADLKSKFRFYNKMMIEAVEMPDMDYLSGTDVKCLDAAIEKCKGLTFGQRTDLSHGYAWHNTARDRQMEVSDILSEAGDSEEYVNYVVSKLRCESYQL